jgi:hypothetical protein
MFINNSGLVRRSAPGHIVIVLTRLTRVQFQLFPGTFGFLSLSGSCSWVSKLLDSCLRRHLPGCYLDPPCANSPCLQHSHVHNTLPLKGKCDAKQHDDCRSPTTRIKCAPFCGSRLHSGKFVQPCHTCQKQTWFDNVSNRPSNGLRAVGRWQRGN